MTGNTEELGNWNPSKAVTLKTGPFVFPKWNCSVKLTNAAEKLEYKYLIVIETTGYTIQWEPFQGNREVTF